ncbi:sugar ABC transporter ATP-binding protein [Microbispora sp. H10836]|uniref:sugar ABC transporter ATP-binding protein n=1 Tax=Microbispora sp. H10836 TaxID=2729106 RepID=UPI00147432D2|nr:sugar ABC transporter ATP-binding protein [Microbispora sp. H10836]
MTTGTPALTVRGLRKKFNGATVLDGVDITVAPGEIHALLGANGAGKSTLIKILSGIYEADGGEVAIGRGVGGHPGRLSFVHQDLGLVDELTVRENLYLGSSARSRRGFVDHRAERRQALASLARVDLRIDPDVQLSSLGLGAKTLVAVARLMAEDASVIVLDEVTAALTRRESSWLLSEVRKFTEEGGSAILVTHRLHEVTEHCDTVTLLRDGTPHYSGPTPSVHELHEMLSAGVPHIRRARGGDAGPVVAAISAAASKGVGPIDLEVRAGEVVGLVGPLSSNLYAIGHLVAGHLPLTSGSVRISSADGRPGRVALVPEDRRAQGLLHGMDVRANLLISSLRKRARLGFLQHSRERADVEREVRQVNVRPTDPDYPILGLSGGNQQKVLMGRARLMAPDLYVLCEPTRGVDVGTRRAIYKFIDDACAAGAAVIVLSIDLDDIMAVSDRVGLVDDGRITGLSEIDSISADEILENVL